MFILLLKKTQKKACAVAFRLVKFSSQFHSSFAAFNGLVGIFLL